MSILVNKLHLSQKKVENIGIHSKYCLARLKIVKGFQSLYVFSEKHFWSSKMICKNTSRLV